MSVLSTSTFHPRHRSYSNRMHSESLGVTQGTTQVSQSQRGAVLDAAVDARLGLRLVWPLVQSVLVWGAVGGSTLALSLSHSAYGSPRGGGDAWGSGRGLLQLLQCCSQRPQP